MFSFVFWLAYILSTVSELWMAGGQRMLLFQWDCLKLMFIWLLTLGFCFRGWWFSPCFFSFPVNNQSQMPKFFQDDEDMIYYHRFSYTTQGCNNLAWQKVCAASTVSEDGRVQTIAVRIRWHLMHIPWVQWIEQADFWVFVVFSSYPHQTSYWHQPLNSVSCCSIIALVSLDLEWVFSCSVVSDSLPPYGL